MTINYHNNIFLQQQTTYLHIALIALAVSYLHGCSNKPKHTDIRDASEIHLKLDAVNLLQFVVQEDSLLIGDLQEVARPLVDTGSADTVFWSKKSKCNKQCSNPGNTALISDRFDKITLPSTNSIKSTDISYGTGDGSLSYYIDNVQFPQNHITTELPIGFWTEWTNKQLLPYGSILGLAYSNISKASNTKPHLDAFQEALSKQSTNLHDQFILQLCDPYFITANKNSTSYSHRVDRNSVLKIGASIESDTQWSHIDVPEDITLHCPGFFCASVESIADIPLVEEGNKTFILDSGTNINLIPKDKFFHIAKKLVDVLSESSITPSNTDSALILNGISEYTCNSDYCMLWIHAENTCYYDIAKTSCPWEEAFLLLNNSIFLTSDEEFIYKLTEAFRTVAVEFKGLDNDNVKIKMNPISILPLNSIENDIIYLGNLRNMTQLYLTNEKIRDISTSLSIKPVEWLIQFNLMPTKSNTFILGAPFMRNKAIFHDKTSNSIAFSETTTCKEEQENN
ncbi:MAG TPA: hypothetical protein EYO58_11030 [Flavobacteriales bacterium]|nr:hypothetical protein [Flavobacteriales bacterium]